MDRENPNVSLNQKKQSGMTCCCHI